MFSFGPFRLDTTNACVWHDTEALRLSLKAFAVLQILVAQAGTLVPKETLLEAAWPDVAVNDAVLTVCIGELRRALGDTARAPRFIETVHRRGYRFLAPVTRSDDRHPPPAVRRVIPPEPPLLVGREEELRRLHGCWVQAQCSVPQLVFVTGEAGIGKTTLVDAFVAQLKAETPIWTVRGQCISHYGNSEPYLPVLDALNQLCREPEGERALALLEQHAPTWLVHLPALLSAAAFETLQRKVQGATPERMLREITEALEALTAECPVLLVLEDLHWCDVAMLDLLAWLARRRQPARLMLVGTYRPVEVIMREHALREVIQELALHRLCTELPLELLNEAEIEQYLTVRYGQCPPHTLVHSLHQRTEGNPLFLTTLVDSLPGSEEECLDSLAEASEELNLVPESLRGMIEQRLVRCSAAERRVVEAASVAGVTFTVEAVAAGLVEAVEAVEHHCAELARRGFFLPVNGLEEWPDGTVTECYGFRHTLYRQTVYEQLAPGRQHQLHRRIGQQLETSYGVCARERAAELAQHFEHGRDLPLAIRYHRLAAATALERWTYQETIHHLEAALRLMHPLPETPQRLHQELHLQTQLGPALIATQGYSAPALQCVYTRALELCDNLEDTQQLVRTVWGLFQFHTARGDLRRAEMLADQLLTLARQRSDAAHTAIASLAKAFVLANRGELTAGRPYLEHASMLSNTLQADVYLVPYGFHPGVLSLSRLADILWWLGYPAQALEHSCTAHRLARQLAHPYSLAIAGFSVARLHTYRREWTSALRQAEALIALATRQGFHWYEAWGTMLRGRALVAQGQKAAGLAQLDHGLTAYRETETRLSLPYALTLQAQAYRHVGHVEAGLGALAEALRLADAMAAPYQAELYRLKGELLLQANQETRQSASQPEDAFRQALDLARRQQAKSLELRAATSLARRWQQQGKRRDACDLLAPIYHWFTEGLDTADLREARALLDGRPHPQSDGLLQSAITA
jgi:DNA-binding winged helix-turn-helix (wHTH) protein